MNQKNNLMFVAISNGILLLFMIYLYLTNEIDDFGMFFLILLSLYFVFRFFNAIKMYKKIIFLKTSYLFFLTLIIITLKSCISYDKALIYKKNYIPGKNNQLLLDGFYQTEKESCVKGYLEPVFFYDDGSVVFLGLIKDTIELRKLIQLYPKEIWGIWGNYKIINDTITIETFPANINTFSQERNLTKGIISKNKITFFEEINRKGGIGKTNEIINFIKFETKPDSTANWIRKKRKYNK